MRRLVVLTFMSLDGVVQAPGAPDEDRSGGFAYGGWTFPYFDEVLGQVMKQQMSPPFDLLLGRNTYELFAGHWPQHPDEPGAKEINGAKKYVISDKPMQLTWQNSVLVDGDVVAKIKALKQEEGPPLQVHGSSNLVQTLLRNDLVDELWLKIFPITLGNGKRLFGEGTIPAAFKLIDSRVSPGGVLIASYKRAGAIKTGSIA